MNWEYQIRPVSFDEIESAAENLNEMGRGGWDLVTIVPNAAGTDGPVAIYKRPTNGRRNNK
jgi:hypothetical protein